MGSRLQVVSKQQGAVAMTTERERAAGALYGLAIGDALGMPTQMLPRETVIRLYPTLTGFMPGPSENDISRGQPAGRVTDDTEQALILAELLVEGHGQVDVRRFADRLLRWAEVAEADGSEQLGPSSRQALDAVRRGVPPEEAGRHGHTDGAAMRIAPLGVATSADSLERLAGRVADAVRGTHFTGLAIAGASAVAAAVSLGVAGASFAEQVQGALAASDWGQRMGHYVAGPMVARRIAWAMELVRGRPQADALQMVADLVGTGVETQEAVPAAFAVWQLFPDDPWQVCLAAATLGGDSDTIGAMAGAMAGARCGAGAWPAQAAKQVEAVNHLDVWRVADALLDVRHAS